jgi:short-subunit dehydrogenase
MARAARQFAIITGASTGIGFDLARECAEHGFDLLIAADEPEISDAAGMFRRHGTEVMAVRADLTDKAGVDKLYAATGGRPVDTNIGQQDKDDPRMVAKAGFEAMMAGKGEVITGWQNKLRAAIAHVMPADKLAEMHRGKTQPQR